MNKRKTVYLHVLIWLFAVCAKLPLSGSVSISEPKYLVSYIFGFLYLMLVFYLFYFIVVPIFLNKKRLTEFLIVSLAVVLFMPLVGYLFLYLFRALFEGTFNDFFMGYSLRTHMSGFFPVMTAAISGSCLKVILNWFDAMNQKSETEKQKLAVELELLRSKLNPHFLFNTLNNIDSLIITDTKNASLALVRLSEIMRYLTYETVNDEVAFEKEVDYLNNMIELYRLRLKNRDLIKFEYSYDEKISITPGILSPLVENALKHSSFRNEDKPVIIKLKSLNGLVTLYISNYFEANDKVIPKENSGSGLAGLKRRLDLVYPGRHTLNIEKLTDRYIATLTIEANGDQMYSN